MEPEKLKEKKTDADGRENEELVRDDRGRGRESEGLRGNTSLRKIYREEIDSEETGWGVGYREED